MPRIDEISTTVKPYMEYLDKEMTIQGVLTAFCLGAAGLFGEKVLGASTPEHGAPSVLYELQSSAFWFVVATIAGLSLAGLLFYAQRSLLVLRVGDIALKVAYLVVDGDDVASTTKRKEELFTKIKLAEHWTIWNRYKAGLWWLGVASLESLLALVSIKIKLNAPCAYVVVAIPLLVAGAATAYYLVQEN